MGGPGPSRQAKAAAAAAREARATRRASGEVATRVQESPRARLPSRGRRAEDSAEEEEGEEEDEKDEDEEDEDEEDGSSEDEDEDDEEEGGEEKPPIHHHKIWKKLLREASQGGQLRYVNRQPESGLERQDVTAPERSQVTWDMTNRQHWPDVLTLWNRPNPWNNPTYNVGVMKYKGRVVLDFKDRPIRNFRIPATISSKVEGLRMEAWLRADNRLSFADIEARVRTEVGKDGKIEPIWDKRVLSKRASNARKRAGLISWIRKKGSERQTAFLDSLRTQAQRDNNLAKDSNLDAQQWAQLELLGVNKNKKSNAPTRNPRISKLKRTAATPRSVAGPSPVAATATAGPSNPAAAITSDEGDLTDDSDVREASEDDTDDEGSVSSSLIDPADSRHDQPLNVDEVAQLRRALRETTGHFYILTGQEPQPTNPGDNYFSQWGMLQEQLRNIWTSRGNPGEAPRLRARDRWTGGISRYGDAVMVREEDDEESE